MAEVTGEGEADTPVGPGEQDRAWIEAARRAMTRHMKRQGRVWIRIFPDVPVTSKPTEVRMGKGKGAVEYYVAVIKPGMLETQVAGWAYLVGMELGGAYRHKSGSRKAKVSGLTLDIALTESCDTVEIEIIKCRAKVLSLGKDGAPA